VNEPDAPVKIPEVVRFVVEAFVSDVCPVAVSAEVKRLDAVTPVVEALMILASVEYSVVAVSPVVDAVAKLDCPCTVRIPDAVTFVAEAFWRLVCPVTASAPAVADVAARLVDVEFVDDALVATKLVVVAFVAVRLVNAAVTALKSVEKKLVAVKPVDDALPSVV
jgi:hypothetical protein